MIIRREMCAVRKADKTADTVFLEHLRVQTMTGGAALRGWEGGHGPRGHGESGQGKPEEHPCQQPDYCVDAEAQGKQKGLSK